MEDLKIIFIFRRKEKKTTNEKLKEELQAVMKELAAKMLTGELIENKIEENNN